MEKVIIGNAELYHGDCREILPTLPKCDLILTDPPYGINESAKQGMRRVRPTKKWNNPLPSKYEALEWDNETADLQTIKHLTSVGKCIIWGGNYYQMQPSSCWLVWDKLTTGDFADCELAWTNLKKAVRKFQWLWSGFKKQQPEERYHPTQKPVALMQWCLQQAGMPQQVLDPYMGSGTTGVACMNLGCKFIGIEKERTYFDIACKRIERAQQQLKLFSP